MNPEEEVGPPYNVSPVIHAQLWAWRRLFEDQQGKARDGPRNENQAIERKEPNIKDI